MWDPDMYLRYAEERGRAFFDLIGQIRAPTPKTVVDLGCGPGDLTAILAQRWPHADVTGIDCTPAMIDRAREQQTRVRYELADLRRWSPGPDTGVVVSNAALQWVDGHAALLREWGQAMPPGSWLAFHVPGNFDSPSHRCLRALANSQTWTDRLASLVRGPDTVLDANAYANLLTTSRMAVNAWETTYVHLLETDQRLAHPVLQWMEGTALRPIRAALEPAEWTRFRAELNTTLAEAYPTRRGMIALALRRIFVVAHVPE